MSTDKVLQESFSKIVADRYSCRGFKPDPIPKEIIDSILKDAQRAPSNCNTQPWTAHVVTGKKRDELVAAYLEAWEKEKFNNGAGDFVFDAGLFTGVYHERKVGQSTGYYNSVAATLPEGQRPAIMTDNFSLYGAPAVIIFTMPDIGEGNVRQASDIGQYAMTFMLSCQAHGISTLPQTALGMKASVPRKVLNIPDTHKVLFGVSFGYEDKEQPGNQWRMHRAPLEETVVFHE